MSRTHLRPITSLPSASQQPATGSKPVAPPRPPPRPRGRRGFNLIELLIALSISAALLTATMVALNASFLAYQSTTEQASTHTIGRMLIHRLQALVRTGHDFEPAPADPTESIVTSNELTLKIWTGADLDIEQEITIRFDEDDEALYVQIDGGAEHLLMEGVLPQYDGDGDLIPPFTLEYVLGHKLYRATIDLTIVPDDNMSVALDGQYSPELRLVASAMPRNVTF